MGWRKASRFEKIPVMVKFPCSCSRKREKAIFFGRGVSVVQAQPTQFAHVQLPGESRRFPKTVESGLIAVHSQIARVGCFFWSCCSNSNSRMCPLLGYEPAPQAQGFPAT